MRRLGKTESFSSTVTFAKGLDANSQRVLKVAAPTISTDGSNRSYASSRILYGPVANRPANLEPGQLYAGW